MENQKESRRWIDPQEVGGRDFDGVCQSFMVWSDATVPPLKSSTSDSIVIWWG